MSLPNWLRILAQIGPQVLLFTPLAPIAPVVVSAIGEASAMAGATKAEKLAHVVNIATDAAAAVNVHVGHEVINPAVIQATAASAISSAVQITNMVHAAQQSGVDVGAAVAAGVPVPVTDVVIVAATPVGALHP